MAELVQLQGEMDLYVQDDVGIVAVTVASVEGLAATKRKSGVMFPVVSDVDGTLMDLFGLRDEGADVMTGGDIPRSASVLVAADGTVIWKELAENYRVRPEPNQGRSAAAEYFNGKERAAAGTGVGRFKEMR